MSNLILFTHVVLQKNKKTLKVVVKYKKRLWKI